MTLDHSVQRGFQRAYRRDRVRNRYRHGRPVGRLIAGSLIAVWGVALLLENLGMGDVRLYMHRVWPAVLVIAGITLLIRRDPSRNRYGFWGAMSLFAGVWLYASQQLWIHAGFWALLGPALLVMLGASFVYRGVTDRPTSSGD